MAIEIIEDVSEGSGLTMSDQGATIERVFFAKGLTATPASKLVQRIYDSVDAQTNFIMPSIGDFHPTIPSMIAVDVVGSTIMSASDKGRIRFTYRSTLPRFTVSSTTIREIAEFDIGFNPLLINYLPNGGSAAPNPTATGVIPAFGQTTVYRPCMAVEFERIRTPKAINGQISGNPFKDAKYYTGTVNDESIWGGAAYTWLCDTYGYETVLVPFRNAPIVAYWRERIRFLFRGSVVQKTINGKTTSASDSWFPVIAYRNPVTRKIATDIDPSIGLSNPNTFSGNGWIRPQTALAASFKDMNLPDISAL